MANSTQNVLFLTNCELGQCNVAIAVAEEFILRDKFTVHIASFRPLAELIEKINRKSASSKPAIFHEIYGPCMEDLAVRSGVGLITHKPGVLGTIEGFQKVNRAMSSWTPQEYKRASERCVDILKEVQPDVIVLDPILHVGLEACRGFTSRLVVLWPVPLKDVVILNQPRAKALWQYPITGSGYSYPLSWTMILPNIYLLLRAALLMSIRHSPSVETRQVNESSGRTPFPLKSAYEGESLHLTPAFPEMDFPLSVPTNVISCGPILRQHLPLSEVDPGMEEWLKRPTILISLGSHVRPTEAIALQMAKGIQLVLNKHTDIQVLWKLRYDWRDSVAFQDTLGTFIDSSLVMIVDWIEAGIAALLETGKISIYVHHGGANSYFEACKFGVPQVVLPQWLDTYDCATRVEWLEIGAHGSQNTAPGIEANEFSDAINKVLYSSKIRSQAGIIKELCKTTEGRVFAHDQISRFAFR
ncbi:hypothetical protein N7456_012684 [Penicillium angulare]|uniref:Erythromycin biosynthesis protein CIII-like C-terminal domain-containing protein n=1 Tax=Penicillium angulare TaxID=116970 RepID=A0A9W9EK38_9EURO|nr:hypothetical protein N7456_012684 [Penicillium angulare]